MYLRILLTALLIMPCDAIAQAKSTYHRVELPNGPLALVPSPNKRWTLVFECPNDCRERNLWIEDSSHTRRLVKKYERTLAIAWAPDSGRFFVNDDYGSNGSESSVIDPITLKSTDLGMVITDHDAEAKQFLGAGHSYVSAKRWLNGHVLIAVLFGHFDEAPPSGVPASFTAEYRVDLTGFTEKVFQHSREEPY
jgi:hypothetical protein